MKFLFLELILFLNLFFVSLGWTQVTNIHDYQNENNFNQEKISGDFYQIRFGDTFYGLFGSDWKIVSYINRVSPKSLRPGMKLFTPSNLREAKVKYRPLPQKIDQDVQLFIDLDKQVMGQYNNRELVSWYPISSGKKGHRTPIGLFRISQKEKRYRSKTYPKPYGGAPMPFAMRFHGPYWIHGGELPGRPDSYGCIRLMFEDAQEVFKASKLNDLVFVTKNLN